MTARNVASLVGLAFAGLGLCLRMVPGIASDALPPHAQGATFHFEQAYGPFSVGLKVVEQYDRSRRFPATNASPLGAKADESSRPLQTLVWYPAAASTSPPMTVGDYISLAKTETAFASDGHPGVTSPMYDNWSAQLALPSSAPLGARRNATPLQTPFPVVIYAPGSSSVAWDNADLCEYLASYGYVVIASPSMAADSRDMGEDIDGVRTQARDISFLIDYAKTLPDTDMANVAVAGWSWGGLSAVFAAARDRRIDALVALDGSFRYFPALVQQAGDVHPDQMTVPLLAFTQGNITLEQVATSLSGPESHGPNVLNLWTHGDLLSIDMLGMSHPEFSAMVQRRKNAAQFAEDQKADYGRGDANAGYGWVARYTLAFLDARLKRKAEASTFLMQTPAQSGVPPHVMASAYRPASPGDTGRSPHP